MNIAPDNASTVTDLEVRDYFVADGNCGYWTGRSGADLINLNVVYFQGYGTAQRYGCVGHEFGHARTTIQTWVPTRSPPARLPPGEPTIGRPRFA